MKNIEQKIKSIEKKSKTIGFDQISDSNVGSLLVTLCASKPHGKFLELGTGCGLSTVWMSDGIDAQSRLISVDNDEKVIAIAKEHLSEDERITFICGSGEAVIDDIEDHSIDLIFADTWPGKYHYLEEALALLKVGGIYIIDDMLPQENWPEGHEKKVDALVNHLHERDDFKVVKLNWASGVMIATKIKYTETNHWNPPKLQQTYTFCIGIGNACGGVA
jgi:predicted O-methyltransferase YrrM